MRGDEGEPGGREAVAPGLDMLGDTLSWYFRVLELQLSRDLARRLAAIEPLRGKGRITALVLIDGQPGLRAADLAQVTLMDRSAVARILGGLEAAGLIARAPSPVDSRAQELSVTPAGARMAARLRELVARQSEEFFAVLPPADRASLLELLRRAYHGLQERRA